ncbi:uncharacterized protein LOC118646556 [Monomorium pharaonis]|uniref:uncharacterized protein LOC118646556 n=1 Tax=Monomorium pharaonis TaxID=307658 RepID=UPI001747725A|nr:uncharacterized protein LOC118646556 [Monomorium pharaonis]
MADDETVIDVDALRVEELKVELGKLKLKCSGNKSELRERLRAALRRKEDNEDEKTESDTDDEDDREENDERETEPLRREIVRQALSCKDVKDSMQPFSGDGGQNIRKWLEEFEETFEICGWPEPHKIIYAKKLLQGSAKVFVSYEKRLTTWAKLKKSLTSEFGKTVNSKKVHQELVRTKKKNNESYQEYMYWMLEIASHADIETEAKIQYIIDGIQDDVFNKSVLYGASDIKALRKKLSQYENMSVSKIEASTSREEVGSKIGKARNGRPRIEEPGEAVLQLRRQESHRHKLSPQEKGNEVLLVWLIRTCGSKVPKEERIQPGEQRLALDDGEAICKDGPETACRGIGLNRITTLGNFTANVTIDDENYELSIHVIPDAYLSNDLILGSDLLKRANVQLNGTNIIITKRIDKNDAITSTEHVPEIFRIEVMDDSRCEIDERCRSNVTKIPEINVSNDELKLRVETTINNYKPCATKQVGIKLDLILKDDVPVYERPRRLAPRDKERINEHIQEWLQQGIIKPSTSEYASTMVLVRKGNDKTRLCIDYRTLNRKVVKDRYPLPLIDDQLDRLQGSNLFSVLNLKNGFFHVPVSENSQKYTAFIVPDGHFEFLKTPFGLSNAPAIFQKFIKPCFEST